MLQRCIHIPRHENDVFNPISFWSLYTHQKLFVLNTSLSCLGSISTSICFRFLQTECQQLHSTLEATERVAAQLRWQTVKQQRQLAQEMELVEQRKNSLELKDAQQERFQDRLNEKATVLEKEKLHNSNIRSDNVAYLRREREAHFIRHSFSLDNIFMLREIIISWLFLLTRILHITDHRRHSQIGWQRWLRLGKTRVNRKSKLIRI